MIKNEVITLSSDEEEKNCGDNSNQCQVQVTKKYINPLTLNTPSVSSKVKNKKAVGLKNEITDLKKIIKSFGGTPKGKKKHLSFGGKRNGNINENNIKIKNIKSPEVVDLEELEKKEPLKDNTLSSKNNLLHQVPNLSSGLKNFHSSQVKTHIDSYDCKKDEMKDVNVNVNVKENIETYNPVEESIKHNKVPVSSHSPDQSYKSNIDIKFDSNLITIKPTESEKSIYDEFVDLCMSLEPIPNDKYRLQKKLHKCYKEATAEYVQENEFKNLIKKCKAKINVHNLYLVAKEVCDELCSRKALIPLQKSTQPLKLNNENKVELISTTLNSENKRKKKIINKIIKQLDILGTKIHELEEAEVDLSDEEESTYIQLQRYRYKFCSIYKKLCKCTNQVSDANRIYSRKICFSGSKYPNINQCIENWLNKTKRFPDFTDIMKLLEDQSSSLGLPSTERQYIREIAIEIFQKVGVMLQQRRKYDLWDSFCGYLDESEDPAKNNPELDSILKKNYENRLSKEQKIIQHYAEMQEKERLKPEEVLEEDSYNSPTESGNEDEREIQEIEELINEKMDIAIEEEKLFEGILTADTESKGLDICDSGNITKDIDDNRVSKETKNNFKNCKSLKWRKKVELRDNKNNDDCRDEFSKLSEKKAETNETENPGSKNTIAHKFIDNDNKNAKASKSRSSHGSTEISISMKLPTIQLKRVAHSVKTEIKSFDKEVVPPPMKKQKLLPSENSNSDNFSNNSKDCQKLDLYFEVRFSRVEHNFKNFSKINYGTSLNRKITKMSFFKNLNNKHSIKEICFNKLNDQKFRMLTPCYWRFRNRKNYFREKHFRPNYKFIVAKDHLLSHNKRTKKISKLIISPRKTLKKNSRITHLPIKRMDCLVLIAAIKKEVKEIIMKVRKIKNKKKHK